MISLPVISYCGSGCADVSSPTLLSYYGDTCQSNIMRATNPLSVALKVVQLARSIWFSATSVDCVSRIRVSNTTSVLNRAQKTAIEKIPRGIDALTGDRCPKAVGLKYHLEKLHKCQDSGWSLSCVELSFVEVSLPLQHDNEALDSPIRDRFIILSICSLLFDPCSQLMKPILSSSSSDIGTVFAVLISSDNQSSFQGRL